MARAWRRTVMAGAAAISLSAGIALAQQRSGCGTDLKGAERADSPRYTVVYRAQPARIEVARHFSLAIAVCAKAGAPTPQTLRVDARMPEHGHGMNYQATVKSLGHGRFQADGLMFHMPGRWEFAFEVQDGGAAERVLGNFML